MNAPPQLARAIQLHQSGKLAEAETIYRGVLAQNPKQADALHLLGLIAYQTGRHDAALQLVQRAIAEQPVPEYHNSLGEVLQALGRFPQAVESYRKALRGRPDYAEAHNNLGNALRRTGQVAAAIHAFESAIRRRPDYPEAYNNLGVTRFEAGNIAEAIACYRKALALRPRSPEFQANLGVALGRRGALEEAEQILREALRSGANQGVGLRRLAWVVNQRGRPEEAVSLYQSAMAANPADAESVAELAAVLSQLNRKAEAIAAYRQAVRLRPDFHEAHNNLGNLLKDAGRAEESEQAFRTALQIKPDYPIARYNLGVVHRDEGRMCEAIDAFRAALALKPDYALAHSALTFAQLYDPRSSPEEILAEHRRWDQQHAAAWRSSTTRRHANTPHATRRLRVGYVSADFRDHAVGRNIHPLFRHHDPDRFEVFAYAQTTKKDWMTERLRGLVAHWREIQNLEDQSVAELIARDEIDILVDLGLHTGGNRLLVFARKPAPVQVTFAGYPGTTGLEAIDYRLTDRFLDPPGNDTLYVEQSIRLASFWCFDPFDDDPMLIQHRTAGEEFTWGCLNNPMKVNDAVLAVWAQVLAATPLSRMLVLAPTTGHQQRIRDGLTRRGIDRARIEFVPTQSRSAYLATYNRCEAVLDTFPYTGHTTTCDALWMGVPVVTFVGRHAVARGGYSLLSNLGLEELAAKTTEEYVRIATALEADRSRLRRLHAELRGRMESSPLMDAPAFARDIEAAFLAMWQRWCARAIP